jgi:hypothetical protein
MFKRAKITAILAIEFLEFLFYNKHPKISSFGKCYAASMAAAGGIESIGGKDTQLPPPYPLPHGSHGE